MKFSRVVAALLLVSSPAALSAQDMVSLSVPSSAPSDIFSGNRSKDVLLAQVLLDRSRHSPGVIDGMMGGNTRRAIMAFERDHGLPVDGNIDKPLIEKLLATQGGNVFNTYEISQDDVNGPFHNVPDDMVEMAKLERLPYQDPVELLAEKFHMTQAFLKALNPGVDFSKAGTKINVVAAGDGKLGPSVARIEVDKAASRLRAYDGSGKLVATYPATVGSDVFPSPSGAMQVKAIAPDPKYYFDPSGRQWGPDKKLTIASGPNNPVGTVWIDLSKEGYGIHGTPEPRMIGKTSSHGCVRLTNWDATELSQAVSQGTKVEFV